MSNVYCYYSEYTTAGLVPSLEWDSMIGLVSHIAYCAEWYGM